MNPAMRTSQWTWAGVALCALTLAACKDDGGKKAIGGNGGEGGQGGRGGAGPGGHGGAGQGGNGGEGGSAKVTCDGPTGALDVAGVWAGRAAMRVGVEGKPGGMVTVCPEDQEGTAELLFMMSMQQSGTGLSEVRAVLCDAKLPPVTAVVGTCQPGATGTVTAEILVPDGLRGALPGLEVTPITGTLAQEAPGAKVTFARLQFTAGAAPSVETLPSWDVNDPACDAWELGRSETCEAKCVEDCGTLRDHDGDNFPGVTLDVCGRTQDDEGKQCPAEDPANGVTVQGRAFTVIRVDPELGGTATSSCEITGNVDASIQYSIIGADVQLAGLPLPVSSAIEALPNLQVKPEESKMRLVRVDGRYGTKELGLDPSNPAAACEKLLEQKNELF